MRPHARLTSGHRLLAGGVAGLVFGRSRRLARGRLLASGRLAVAAAMVVAIVAGATLPARADGGKGGNAGAASGGAGGAGFTGVAGGTTFGFGGGGGGGAGGGAGGTGAAGGTGGAGGTSVLNPNGQNGVPAFTGGGGGGGGGWNGNDVGTAGSGAATIPNGSTLSGGAGGSGGGGTSSGGGGGGAGGYGALVTGSGASNSGTIAGGGGGAGGQASSSTVFGGNGGDGGVGVQITTTGATFTNSGAIAGGNGGAGGSASFGATPGNPGAGGAGIVGAGLTVTNSNTISGGLGGNGVTHANAITFTGGANMLTLQTGWSLSGSINVTGSVTFNQAIAVALSNVIAGSGSVIQSGSGTLTLSGANTYAGGTATNAGMLAVSSDGNLGNASGGLSFNGGTLQYLAGFTSNRTVTLNSGGGTFDTNGNSATLSGTISGTGGLTKLGAGTLTLAGSSTYFGATAVNAGTLMVNGSIAGSILTTVNNGGTLAGTGTMGATTIHGGGTLAPGPGGGAIGTLTIAGNLAFQSGALYLVQVNPSNASSANVTAGGTATLAGTVQAVFAPGVYMTRSYAILHSAGLGGTTFSGVSGNDPAGFAESLSYTGTDVFLNLDATLGSGPGAPGTGGLNGNQGSVANALNNFFNSGGTLPPNFVTIFGLTGGNLANALTLLSGEAATGAQEGAFELTTQFLGTMLDPFVDGRGGFGSGPALGFAPERAALPDEIALAYAKAMKAPVYKAPPPAFEQRWTAWGSAYGGTNKTSGDPLVGSHDLSARAGRVAAGLDYRLSHDTVVGFALAGGGTDWSLAQGLGGGKSDAFQAGVYGASRFGPAYLAAAFAFTDHWISTDRTAAFDDHLTASFNAQSLGGRVEGGYRFATLPGGITPYAALQAQNFHTPSYAETDVSGGGFALAYNARNASDTRSELGARFDHGVVVDPTKALILRGRLAWAHDWVSDPTLAAVFQTLPGASFIVNGATPAKDSALASAGAELALANGVSLLGKFDGELAAHSATYAGTGTVRFAW